MIENFVPERDKHAVYVAGPRGTFSGRIVCTLICS